MCLGIVVSSWVVCATRDTMRRVWVVKCPTCGGWEILPKERNEPNTEKEKGERK